jgi:hypothetical protein
VNDYDAPSYSTFGMVFRATYIGGWSFKMRPSSAFGQRENSPCLPHLGSSGPAGSRYPQKTSSIALAKAPNWLTPVFSDGDMPRGWHKPSRSTPTVDFTLYLKIGKNYPCPGRIGRL